MPKYLVVEGTENAEEIFPLNEINKLRVDNFAFCMVRTSKGYFAFEKTCPHQGHSLNLARINNINQLICPHHDYAFDLKFGDEDGFRCRELILFKVFWEEDKLFVELR